MTRTRPAVALVALALVLAGCASDDPDSEVKETGTATAEGPATAQTVALDMNDDLQFVPNVVKAVPGTLTIALDNVGRIPHNLVFKDELGGTETIGGGEKASLKVTLGKAGTYRFVCTFHSGMDGQVVVAGEGS